MNIVDSSDLAGLVALLTSLSLWRDGCLLQWTTEYFPKSPGMFGSITRKAIFIKKSMTFIWYCCMHCQNLWKLAVKLIFISFLRIRKQIHCKQCSIICWTYMYINFTSSWEQLCRPPSKILKTSWNSPPSLTKLSTDSLCCDPFSAFKSFFKPYKNKQKKKSKQTTSCYKLQNSRDAWHYFSK